MTAPLLTGTMQVRVLSVVPMVAFVYAVKARVCEARKVGSSPTGHPNVRLAQWLAHRLDVAGVQSSSL